jgi:hypothetical protein
MNFCTFKKNRFGKSSALLLNNISSVNNSKLKGLELQLNKKIVIFTRKINLTKIYSFGVKIYMKYHFFYNLKKYRQE